MTIPVASLVLLLASIVPGARAQSAESPCKLCHEEYFDKQFDHYPASAGFCDHCHQVPQPHLDGEDFGGVTKEYSAEKTCLYCHSLPGSGSITHKAMSAGKQCVNCHNPHGGENRTFLIAEAPQLCTGCHKGLDAGNSVHGVATSGKACLTCHRPHSGRLGKLLVQSEPQLCLSCHNKRINKNGRTLPDMAKLLSESTFVHEPVKSGCSECHSPHASPYDSLLADHYPSATYTAYDRGSRQTPNTYALCFNCHDQGMLNSGSYSTEFRDDGFKGPWRGPRVNLHEYHVVNRQGTTGGKMGRTCRICHDPHGAMQAHLLNKTLGPTEQPMDFVARDNGGECTKSCHDVKKYQRE